MIRIFFGSPGAGKTTLIHFLCCHSNYKHYLTNFDSKLIIDRIKPKKIGSYSIPPNTKIFIDEAGICFNNRMYKSLDLKVIEYLKKHRHEKVDIDFFSQSWEDIDITVRRLADELWYIRKIGSFTFCRKIEKFVAPPRQENDWQIKDGYRFRGLLWKFIPIIGFRSWFVCFRPKYYKYFDSFDRLPLPPLPFRIKEYKKKKLFRKSF